MALILPTEKSIPNVELNKLKILIYGEPKVSKTSLARGFKEPLFIRTSQSTEVSPMFKLDVRNWSETKEAITLITSGKHNFQGVVLDVIDDMYHYCVNACNEKLKIDHISDAAYAKAYHYSDNEFEFWMGKLLMSDYGVVILSHLDEKQVIENKSTVTKIIPSLATRARRIIEKKVAIITWLKRERVRKAGAALAYEEKLVLITKQSVEVAAGDWTGMMPDKLVLDTIPEGIQRTDSIVEEYAKRNYALIESYIKGNVKKEENSSTSS